MNINKHLDVVNACRFCFMCRHLAPVGNVTCKEADTPRGRALILDKVRMDNRLLENHDYTKTIYDAAMSAACRYHCVSRYDENTLLLAARQDIVEKGLAPQNVKDLAKELQNVDFKIDGEGDILYYVDEYSKKEPKIVDAFLKLSGKLKTICGGDSGKALKVLGFVKESQTVAEKFAVAIKKSNIKTLVTSCPATYDFLKNESPIVGITVLHSSEFLMQKKLKSKTTNAVYYLESDFLKNYNHDMPAPKELLKSLGYDLKQFGTNTEESYSAGEGAVIYDRLNPQLAKKLCERIANIADSGEKYQMITASPYTLHILKAYKPELDVISIEQAALAASEVC